MIYRPRGGSHNYVRQTFRSFEVTVLDIIFLKWSLYRAEDHTTRYNKYPVASRSPYWIFSLSMRYKLKFRSLITRQHECALLAQEAHTSPKSHHELNSWHRILLLKLKLLKMRIIKQVTKQVSKGIKRLIQVVNKSN
jgi:hypothetical protein